MPVMLLMFDCEGPTLEDLPAPLVAEPCPISDIAIEEEEGIGGTEEGTVRLLAEEVCAGAGTAGVVLRVPGAVGGLLALGVTAAEGIFYR